MQRPVTDTGLPLRVLQSLHAFKVQDVRIGPLDAEGLQTVIVEHQVMAGSTLRDLIGRSNRLLVVAVEEVHLETFDAHVGIVRHHGISHSGITQRIVADEATPRRPENDADPFFLTMSNQLWQVDLRTQVLQQRFLATPAFVDDDIFQPIGGSEVYII